MYKVQELSPEVGEGAVRSWSPVPDHSLDHVFPKPSGQLLIGHDWMPLEGV